MIQRDPKPTMGDLKNWMDSGPPSAPESEEMVIGLAIMDVRAANIAIDILKSPDAFYDERNVAIYGAILATFDRHDGVDPAAVAAHMKAVGTYSESIMAHITSASDRLAVTPYTFIERHAVIVREQWRLRRLRDAALLTVYRCHQPGADPEAAREAIEQAETDIFAIGQDASTEQPATAAELMEEALRSIERAEGGSRGIQTGFVGLDAATGGLQAGDMIVVAGRPSMGKTALALNIADATASGVANGEQTPTLIFSLEMSRLSVAHRLVCARAKVSSKQIRLGSLRADEMTKTMNAMERIRSVPLHIDATPALSIASIRQRSRRMVRQHGIGLIVVDYLQLIHALGKKDNRQEQVADISRGLKGIAHELNIPVIVVAQLNRATESTSDKRPRMSNLRESGAIEQDADVIALIHREEYYHIGDRDWADANPQQVGVAEVIIAKQRNGPTGSFLLGWEGRYSVFGNHHTGAGTDFGEGE